MTKEYKGSLKLDWINKDKSLYYEIDESEGRGIKPSWVDKNSITVSEPRILNFEKSYGDENSENILIRGDNLLVLRTLVEQFKTRKEKDKVKCCYIDPPFNTGNAFDRYDDNLQHSEWLTMMRDRLVLIKKLMRKDGVIFVHIDFQELHYLKILLDEIFGRNNFIGQINWQRVPEGRTLLGQGESDLITTTEYILIYAYDINKGGLSKEEKKLLDATNNILEQYSTILKVSGKTNIIDSYKDSQDVDVNIYECTSHTLKNLSKKLLKEEPHSYLKTFIENYANMVQSVGIQDESSSQQKILSYCKKKDVLYFVEYTLAKGKRKGQRIGSYFLNGRKYIFVKDYSKLDNNKLFRESDMNDFWRSEEIPVTGIAEEGGVDFRRSKKPEALLRRIINLGSTSTNDLILDSFAGSGTTGAVAHKMGRRWIMVELGKHAEDLCFKRLKHVVDGSDQSGVSKELNWKGGGGFKYYKLGESLISGKNINWNLTYKQVAEALFYTKNFKLLEHKELEKKNIFVGENLNEKGVYAICTVSKDCEFIKSDEYFELLDKLKVEHDFIELNLYTNKAVNVRKAEQYDNVFIRKIPQTILKKYGMI